MSNIGAVKTQIKAILDGLTTGDSPALREVQEDDFSRRLTDRTIGAYPAAILTTPQVESESFTTGENLRTYTFVVLVLMKAEDVTSPTQVEDLMEKLLDEVDKNFTLSGNADGGVEPSVSTPGPIVDGTKSYIGFTVTIRAKAAKGFR